MRTARSFLTVLIRWSIKETSDGLKIETSSSKIDEQGNVSKKEFSASVLNTDIERGDDRTKGEVRGKVETNIAKAESSRTDQTETGVKETHKSAVIGHDRGHWRGQSR